MVTATIALTHLLSVVPSYGACLLLLRFVIADGRFGRAALGLSLPILGFGILVAEYALPVVIVMVTFFWSYARRAPDPATRARAYRAILFSTLVAGAAYAIFFVMADFSVRRGEGLYLAGAVIVGVVAAKIVEYLVLRVRDRLYPSQGAQVGHCRMKHLLLPFFLGALIVYL
jgi:hypothetical protein